MNGFKIYSQDLELIKNKYYDYGFNIQFESEFDNDDNIYNLKRLCRLHEGGYLGYRAIRTHLNKLNTRSNWFNSFEQSSYFVFELNFETKMIKIQFAYFYYQNKIEDSIILNIIERKIKFRIGLELIVSCYLYSKNNKYMELV